VIGQIGILIVINLVISVATPGIDYQAHIGGLLAGVWLGFLFVPGRVPTLSRKWQMPAGGGSAQGVGTLRILGVAALLLVIVVGVMIGTSMRV